MMRFLADILSNKPPLESEPDTTTERAGFNDEKWDREFLDLIDRDPERLAGMTVEDYMRRTRLLH